MPRSTPPNIVILAIDSMRADHLGCYGYGRPSSPAIDALAIYSFRPRASATICVQTSLLDGPPTMIIRRGSNPIAVSDASRRRVARAVPDIRRRLSYPSEQEPHMRARATRVDGSGASGSIGGPSSPHRTSAAAAEKH